MLCLFRLRLVRWVIMTIWSMALVERDCMTRPLLQMMMMRWALNRNHTRPLFFHNLSVLIFQFVGRRWHRSCPACWESILHCWSTQWRPQGWRCNAILILKIVPTVNTFLWSRCLMFYLIARRSVRLPRGRTSTTSVSGPTCSTLLLGSTLLLMVSSKW